MYDIYIYIYISIYLYIYIHQYYKYIYIPTYPGISPAISDMQKKYDRPSSPLFSGHPVEIGDTDVKPR